jgi:hypothetical protein
MPPCCMSALHVCMSACLHVCMSQWPCPLSGTSLLDGLAARRANVGVTKALASSAQKGGVNTQGGEGGGGGGVTGGDAGRRVGDWVVGQGGYEERLLRDAVLSSPWLWEDRFHISIMISYLNIYYY